MKTRQLFRLSLAFALALLIASCKKDATEKKEDPTPTIQVKDEKLYATLKSVGFRDDQIKDVGEFYEVSGDLLFKKNATDLQQVEQYFARKKPRTGNDSNGKENQLQYPSLISSFNVENITVYVDPVLKNLFYEVGIQEAIGHWAQDIDSKINFSFIDLAVNSPYADVTFVQDNSLTGGYAAGEFPSSGAPGWRVRVNTNASAGLSLSKQTFLFVHELGHVLGLMHTDEGIGTPIPGTPSSDANSVMNSGAYFGGVVPNWNGFSSYDKIAAAYLYPWGTYDHWITFPEGKYTPLYGYSIFGGDRFSQTHASFNVTWNSSLVNTPTVTLYLFEKGSLKGTLASHIPNTGSYYVDQTPLLPTSVSPSYAPLIQIRIVSDANTSISDWTSTFYVGFNGD